MSTRARVLIDTLGLAPHPERGFYIQTYRAACAGYRPSHDGERAASTAIYFSSQPTILSRRSTG
jgi:predicted cupin superfamily sugar epimerase